MSRCVNLPVPMGLYKRFQVVKGTNNPEKEMVDVLEDGLLDLESARREVDKHKPKPGQVKEAALLDLEDVNEDRLSEEEFSQVLKIEKLFAKNGQGIRRGPEGGLSPLEKPQPCYVSTLLGKLGKPLNEAYFCRFICDDGKERPKPVSPKNIRIALVLYQRYMDGDEP